MTEELDFKLPTSIGSLKKHKKNIYFCFIDYTEVFECVDQNKLWKVLKQKTRPSDLLPEKSVCRSRSIS